MDVKEFPCANEGDGFSGEKLLILLHCSQKQSQELCGGGKRKRVGEG